MGKIGINKTFSLQNGQEITIETGKLATQADGAAVVKMGNTMVLATVVSNKEAREGMDYLPLSVDYQEKYASTGKFPGGFFKREARPSEYEILIARLVDRALRPLFPEDYHAETQVIINLISGDKNTLPDALAALAASSAIAVSDIPFNGPISEVRVARIDNEFYINPPIDQLKTADLDIIVAASKENIMMVEGEMLEVSEAVMLEALKFAHEAIKIQIEAQVELAEMVEKSKTKREYNHEANDEEFKQAVKEATYDKIYKVALKGTSKHERHDEFEKIKEEYFSTLSEEDQEEKIDLFNKYFHDVEKEAVRRVILDEKKRLDGRSLNEIRPIWTEVDYLPSAHGSAIFTRGETQSLTTITLGNKMDEQIIDGAVLNGKNNLILHYNFPPFSVGEARFLRGTSRREVGHGNLALRALKPMIPNGEENPYTIRIVSDILESNGSSSMATVCAGSLALMDAGVKLRKPVSGIAMGLITDDGNEKYAILSDILGDEDHLGDMDFKVTGTKDGITACQMDIKVKGLSYQILEEALLQAKEGRLHILGEMAKTIEKPREDYKPFVPRIVQLKINKEFIGAVIGPGGKTIQDIQAKTDTTIVIEEVDNFGVVDIIATDKAASDEAVRIVRSLTTAPELGEVYLGKVTKVTNFGAFVEILPKTEGLLHISEIDWKHIKDIDGFIKTGDKVKVKLIDIDNKTGKLRLSRKVLLPRPPRENGEEK